eukprot:GFYU01010487.1.p1 GENE.GFYU01010487.1~~GFYU01010487.1.p1  ORF type:complete len:846 (-),score=157.03 GFYU01010487.1:839-3283(-)
MSQERPAHAGASATAPPAPPTTPAAAVATAAGGANREGDGPSGAPQSTPHSKRNAPFRASYQWQYGLRICERHPITNEVTVAACRFCETLGRDPGPESARRKRTTNIHYFRKSFRGDVIKRHMTDQHSSHWTRYESMALEEKKTFFSGWRPASIPQSAPPGIPDAPVTVVPRFDAIESYTFLVDRPIVESIVGKLFFPTDGREDNVAVLSMFERNNLTTERRRQEAARADARRRAGRDGSDDEASNSEGDSEDENSDVQQFKVHVIDVDEFNMVQNSLSLGSSFQMTADNMTAYLKQCTGTRVVPFETEKICAIARITLAATLQWISDMMRKAWAFSLYVDTRHDFLLDFSVCVPDPLNSEDILKLHIAAVPTNDSNTAEAMREMITMALDALCADWRKKLIGMAWDVPSKSIPALCELSKLLRDQSLPGFHRVWFGAQRLERVIKDVFDKCLDERFVKKLAVLTSYLQGQSDFIKRIGSKCPRYASTYWRSLAVVFNWLHEYRPDIEQMISDLNEADQATVKPEAVWWLTLTALRKFSNDVIQTFDAIQGQTSQLNLQHQRISALLSQICRMTGIRGPMPAAELRRTTTGDPSNQRHTSNFVGSLVETNKHIENLGFDVQVDLEKLAPFDTRDLMERITRVHLEACEELNGLCSTRELMDDSGLVLPPVLPQELIQITGAGFTSVIRSQMQRLRVTYSLTEIRRLEQMHHTFVKESLEPGWLQDHIRSCTKDTPFAVAWRSVRAYYNPLKEFLRGLATSFPGPSKPDLGFSFLKMLSNAQHRPGAPNFLIEGMLHSQTFVQHRERLLVSNLNN